MVPAVAPAVPSPTVALAIARSSLWPKDPERFYEVVSRVRFITRKHDVRVSFSNFDREVVVVVVKVSDTKEVLQAKVSQSLVKSVKEFGLSGAWDVGHAGNEGEFVGNNVVVFKHIGTGNDVAVVFGRDRRNVVLDFPRSRCVMIIDEALVIFEGEMVMEQRKAVLALNAKINKYLTNGAFEVLIGLFGLELLFSDVKRRQAVESGCTVTHAD